MFAMITEAHLKVAMEPLLNSRLAKEKKERNKTKEKKKKKRTSQRHPELLLHTKTK
jgi:hypothetical protein